MGLVYADIGLSNPSHPDLDPIDVGMLVDSGSMRLVIPQHVAKQLGLAELEKREVTLADGARKLVPHVGPVRVRFGKRNAFTGALMMGDEPSLGAIPMEDMDVLSPPLTRQLIANPANPNIPGSMAVGVRPAGQENDNA